MLKKFYDKGWDILTALSSSHIAVDGVIAFVHVEFGRRMKQVVACVLRAAWFALYEVVVGCALLEVGHMWIAYQVAPVKFVSAQPLL